MKSVWWWLLVKALIFIWIATFIYLKVKDRESFFQELYTHFGNLFEGDTFWLVFIALLLMPLNWFVEAMKWRLLASKIYTISMAEAYIGVLSGLALAFVTPHGLGDYVGRIGQITTAGRARLVGSILIGSVAQLLVTILFGILGVAFYLRNTNADTLKVIVTILSIILAGVAIAIIVWKVPKIVQTIPIARKAEKYLTVIQLYGKAEFSKVFWLSTIRYIVFASQFILILQAFDFGVNRIQQMAGVTWIFLVKSVVPAFNFLSDLGIREFSALQYFEPLLVDTTRIIAASLFLWVMNLLLPTVIGSFFVFRLKLLSRQ